MAGIFVLFLLTFFFLEGLNFFCFFVCFFLLRDLRQCDQCVFMYGYGTSTVVVCFFCNIWSIF